MLRSLLQIPLRVTRHASRVTLVLIVAGCAARQPAQTHSEFIAMGTTIGIDVAATDEAKAREAIAVVRGELEFLGQEWYPWANNGELVRLNQSIAQNQTASVSPALGRLLLRSRELHRVSDGNFDPAVGHLVEIWGFNRADRDPSEPWPTDETLQKWQADHPTFADLAIEGTMVSSRRSDLQLDLGAIGKGHAVDIGIEILKKHGVANALINAGGNLRAIGQAAGSPELRPWRVAIRDPRANAPMAWLELKDDESVSTSGDYERFALRGADRANHILDPKTGRSATHTIAVTVIAADATLADAASTALFVAGPDQWLKIAHDMGVSQALRVDADGKIAVTRELAARLRSPGNEARPAEWRTVDL